MVYGLMMIGIVFLFVPFALGFFWKSCHVGEGPVFRYVSGLLSLMALFEIVAPVMVYSYISVHIQTVLFSVLVLTLCFVLAYRELRIAKDRQVRHSLRKTSVGWLKTISANCSWTQCCCVIGFYILLCVQVYYALFYDIGTWRSDDYLYSVVSQSAIYNDQFFLTDYISGDYLEGIDSKYATCGIYVFYSWTANVTNLNVSIIQHTVCNAVFLVTAYGTFYLLSKQLFSLNEEKTNRYLFLILLSLLYLFGMYGHYSTTFRLLGVIWQGKAILAVIIVPYILSTYLNILDKKRNWKDYAFLSMISLAGISLTMGAVIVMFVIPGMITLFYIVKTRKWNSTWCFAATVVFPLLDVFVYGLGRLGIIG